MLGIERVIVEIKEFEKGDKRDRRFTKRLLQFLPEDRWKRIGFRKSKYVIVPHEPLEWDEETVREQLKKDLEFGWKSYLKGQMINAGRQASVCRSWCEVLEDDLPEDTTDMKKLYVYIANMHGIDLSGIKAEEPKKSGWNCNECGEKTAK